MSDAAPDLIEPVIGYRAWHLGPDALLRPWSFPEHAWTPGVNVARCLRTPGHTPPVGLCSCGIYALSDASDRRLHFSGDQAVGAIAAWGDLEVHASGFRAERACVVALAAAPGTGGLKLERLRRAAHRHRVPIVAPGDLTREASMHGAPVGPPVEWSRLHLDPLTQIPSMSKSRLVAPERGVCARSHVWLETALGSVVCGLTAQLAAALGHVSDLDVPSVGARVVAGDRLATIHGPTGPCAVWAPVSGTVLAVNPRVSLNARLLVDDPEGAGWLVRVLPDRWLADAGECLWGTDARRHYASSLTGARARRRDPFAAIRLDRVHALPAVRSWGEVNSVLAARRALPRFPDRNAVDDLLRAPIAAALAGDRRLRARLGRLDARVEFALTAPGARLVLDLRDGDASIGLTQDGGPADQPVPAAPDMRITCTATAFERWLSGSLDPVGALRRGELASSLPPVPTLRALGVLKYLRPGVSP